MLKFSFWGFAHHGAFLACATATVLACSNDGSGEETAKVDTTDDDAANDENGEASETSPDVAASDADGESSNSSTDGVGASSSDGVGPARDDTASANDDGGSDGESGTASGDQASSDADSGSDGTPTSATDPAESAAAEGAPKAVCEQGETRECVGPGACAGGQICGVDGLWGACDCGELPGDEFEDAGSIETEDLQFEELEPLEVPFVGAMEDEVAEPWAVYSPFEIDFFVESGAQWLVEDAEGASGEAIMSFPDSRTFCVEGEARTYDNYAAATYPGIRIGFVKEFDDEGLVSKMLDVTATKMVGYAFELIDAPETGVIPMWGYVPLGWFSPYQRVSVFGEPVTSGTHVVYFSDADADGWEEFEHFQFLVHPVDVDEAVSTPVPFAFCISNLRPIVRVEPNSPQG